MPLLSCVMCVALLLVPQAASQSTVKVGLKQFLRVMQSGTLEERQKAVQDVAATDAMQQSFEVRQAVAAELLRMKAFEEERERRIARGEIAATGSGLGDYVGLLAELCSQSNDPAVIDALLAWINTGNMVQEALARFHEVALDRVAALAMSDAETALVSGALETLAKMAKSPRSEGEKQRIAIVPKSRMNRTQHAIVWGATMRLAVAVGTQDLVSKVEAVASGALVPPGVETSRDADYVKKFAQAALKGRR